MPPLNKAKKELLGVIVFLSQKKINEIGELYFICQKKLTF